MPTVLRFDGLRVVIYPNDHRPAHVHVIGADAEAVFALNAPDGPVTLRESIGFRGGALDRIAGVLNDNRVALLAAWERIHGD